MDLPTFNTDALSSLTKRIETNLKKPTDQEIKTSTKPQTRAKKKTANHENAVNELRDEKQLRGKKRLHDGEVKGPREKYEGRKSTGAVDNPKGNELRHSKFNGYANATDGVDNRGSRVSVVLRKPLSHGNLKGHGGAPKLGAKDRTKQPSDARLPINETKLAKGQPSVASTARSTVQDEILMLGGTQEDLELIEGAGSESEFEGLASNVLSGKLAAELKKMVRGLGIQEAGVQKDSLSPNNNGPVEAVEEMHPNDIAVEPRKQLGKRKEEAEAGAKVAVRLKFRPRSDWHAAELPPLPSSTKSRPMPSKNTVDGLFQQAKELLEKENKDYALRNRNSSSAHQFYSTIMSSGTLSDKISALTLSAQESPLHNVRALESLVGLAKKRSRGQAVEVLGALKDLLGPGNLLPSDRKLKAFSAQPGLSLVLEPSAKTWDSSALPSPIEEIHLISWAYEDWVKFTYFDILKIMETWCNDEIVFARGKAIDYVYELLRDKPEQEANLLRLLVNKLGDSEKKIASKTSYNILQLETSHPSMKPTIISAIESDLLFRPGQSLHAKYYAIITLNQTVLSGKEEAVARKLLDIYFGLFVGLLTKSEPVKPLVPAVSVVTRNKKGEKQGGGGAGGKKAQKKLKLQAKSLAVDEELREKMLSAVLTGVNRAIPFTKADEQFFEKHLDTLFQVTHSSNFNTSIQALLLIQQLCGSYQAASDRFYRTLYESLLDPRLLTSSKQAMYLNLLFRALRADLKLKRVKAFAKRLLQVVAMHQASFTCGVLYLLRELERVFANLQVFVDQPEEDASDEDEDFRDVEEDGDEGQPARAVAIQSIAKENSQMYNGRKREPEYSNADKSCLWELDPLLLHFHPSVSLFASKLLYHYPMAAKPDLASNTLIHFLDRFVYRNPKKTASGLRGASIMQPLAGGDTSCLLILARSKAGMKAPVNTEAFWKMEGGKVDADEVFFHKYFNTMGRGKELAENKKKAEHKGETGGDSEEGEEDEDEIWKALVDSRPELEGNEDSDLDDGFEDPDSSLAGSADEAIHDDAGDMQDNGNEGMSDDDEAIDFGEDDDALLGNDDEVASDLEEAFKGEVQFGSTKTSAVPKEGKREKKKRRKLKNLPTFASAEDYAAMLDGDDAES
ncbi:MAG: hypothetical protein Q9187_000577 [Circinaria calcarea]